MAFTCSLTVPTTIEAVPAGVSADDYESLVMEACELLSTTGCRFRVSGFGQDWPVDVAYDLSTVLEELPGLIACLRSKAQCELDFYGQGIERILRFVPDGDMVDIHCISRTSWTPDPSVEQASFDDVERMFVRLAADFVTALERVAPSLAVPFAALRFS